MLFNKYDHITGMDRSFPRSLYQVIGIGEDTYTLQILALDGYKYFDQGLHGSFNMQDINRRYRLATEEEIKSYRKDGRA